MDLRCRRDMDASRGRTSQGTGTGRCWYQIPFNIGPPWNQRKQTCWSMDKESRRKVRWALVVRVADDFTIEISAQGLACLSQVQTSQLFGENPCRSILRKFQMESSGLKSYWLPFEGELDPTCWKPPLRQNSLPVSCGRAHGSLWLMELSRIQSFIMETERRCSCGKCRLKNSWGCRPD